MIIFIGIIIFLLGLIIGSFLNCVIYRLKKNESFLTGRSYCPHCRHQLRWYDLIPVLSYIILGARCRYCKKRISIQYPLVEISTALIFLLIFLPAGDLAQGDNFLNPSFLLVISCFLIVIFVYDLKHYIIPDKIIFPAIGIVFLYQLILNSKFLILNYFWAGILPALFFFLLFYFSRGKWLGFGDTKLAFFMGMFLGFPKIIVALFLAFFFGGIIGIGSIVFKKKNLKSEIPFAPFLITGTFLALFWGQNLINWYLSLII